MSNPDASVRCTSDQYQKKKLNMKKILSNLLFLLFTSAISLATELIYVQEKQLINYQTSASEGFVESQFNLGVMYWLGEGGSKYLILRYSWINVASRMAEEKQQLLADPDVFAKIKPYLTYVEINRAKQLAAAWSVGKVFSED